jgi:hypothetical protein
MIFVTAGLCCSGLVKSRIFIALISRESINSQTDERANFPNLDIDSPCDNVLLEYTLALELQARGLTERIYPMLIGDLCANHDIHGTDYFYSSYFQGAFRSFRVFRVLFFTMLVLLCRMSTKVPEGEAWCSGEGC